MSRITTKLGLAVSAWALFGTTTFAQTTCGTAPTSLHLAAGTLNSALADLATQTGCPVQYDKQLTQAFRTHAIEGKLTPVEALTQLVQGTGLEAHTDPKGLSVSQVDQASIRHQATTLQAQLKQAAQTQKLPLGATNALAGELKTVSASVTALAKQQGFVSAAEKASYQRTFAKAEQLLAQAK